MQLKRRNITRLKIIFRLVVCAIIMIIRQKLWIPEGKESFCTPVMQENSWCAHLDSAFPKKTNKNKPRQRDPLNARD